MTPDMIDLARVSLAKKNDYRATHLPKTDVRRDKETPWSNITPNSQNQDMISKHRPGYVHGGTSVSRLRSASLHTPRMFGIRICCWTTCSGDRHRIDQTIDERCGNIDRSGDQQHDHTVIEIGRLRRIVSKQ